jgi:hypothetical protein
VVVYFHSTKIIYIGTNVQTVYIDRYMHKYSHTIRLNPRFHFSKKNTEYLPMEDFAL